MRWTRRSACKCAPCWLIVTAGAFVNGCTIVPMEERGAPPAKQVTQSTSRLPPLQNAPGSFDLEPELVGMSEPQYPETARDSGQEGTVYCDVRVDETGVVREVSVVESVTPLLDQAAVTAARTAVYKPAKRKGAPVAAWARIPVEFRLHQ